MPSVKINDLNSLKGSNTSFIGSLNDGQQTVDKVKDIINGINNILTKVQGFKQQQPAPQNQTPTPIPQVKAPVDMQVSKRAIIEIKEDSLIPLIKEFLGGIDEEAKKKPLEEILSKFEGNEQIIKALLIQLIKQSTQIKYIE